MANLEFHYLEPIHIQNVLVIELFGEIDPTTIPKFKEKLDGLLEKFNHNILIFDLNDLRYINSEGIGLTMDLIKKARDQKRQTILAGLEGEVKEVIELIGLGQIAKTYQHLGKALEDLGINQ